MTKTLKSLMGLIVIAALAWAAISIMAAPQLASAIENAASAVHANQSIALSFIRIPERIGTQYSDAELHHSLDEVMRVRNCPNKGGADRIFREKFKGKLRFHILCQEIDGTWADRVLEKINDEWEEITAFEPKKTTVWKVIQKYMDSKQATPVKTLPW
jgi:hypothetical protein